MVSTLFIGSRLRVGARFKSLLRLSHTKAAPASSEKDHHLYHQHIPENLPPPTTPSLSTHLPAHVQQDEVAQSNLVTMVDDKRTAADVVDHLMSLPKESVVAWDTETTLIDTKKSIVGNGKVICATAYFLKDEDSGDGSSFFVDCWDKERGDMSEILNVFKGYFENENCKKVWHNYSFDRHMLRNCGIIASGFAADTMHMARLVDSAKKSYSLEALCQEVLRDHRKMNMHERFGQLEKLKNGSDGKKISLPDTVKLHCDGATREEWIHYASKDAELTHRLYQELKLLLQETKIDGDSSVQELSAGYTNMFEVYRSLVAPFGEMLTDVENTGFRVDVDWLRKATGRAEEDRLKLEDQFREWAAEQSPDARYMNIHSGLQKQVLFFAPYINHNKRKDEKKKENDMRKMDGDTNCALVVKKQDSDFMLPAKMSFTIKPEEFLPEKYVKELRSEIAKTETEKTEITNSDNFPASISKKVGKLKKEIVLTGLKKSPSAYTPGGWPSVSAPALEILTKQLRANSPEEGSEDMKMCEAIDNLIEASQISTLISTFLKPLQEWPGDDDRIHSSLNLNTETGRLSARRPNLQNQPAFDKDRYKIRKAFVPDEGKSLIVADYGQLELRLLAHIANCKSMIAAFEAGGDFHSRTAMGMFEEVKLAVERGDCALERKETLGNKDSLPLLKDMFSSQRKKAKVLNFSIAYGKTVRGLAKDWNVGEQEAKDTLNLWYKDRPEVERWQRDCRRFLSETGYVETILGRRRHLPGFESDNFKLKNHALRAAINAPIQGSAADLVMAAMVKLHRNRILKSLGWRIILQVHDEIILEGPDESVDIALPIVVKEMRNPMDVPLRVDLTVDAKSAKSWYDAK